MIVVTRPDGSTQEVDADEARLEDEGLFLYRAGVRVYGFGEWSHYERAAG